MPLAALSGKRWSGYLSWRRRRRFVHRREVLDGLTVAVQDEDPACILVTGDLVHIGLAEEIEAATDWLRQLGPPDRVMLVPGNHDVYARDSWPVVASAWAPYLGVSAAEDKSAANASPVDEATAGFPTRRRLDGVPPVELIGVSSACPAPLFMASGRLGGAQLARLDAALTQAQGFRCLLIHHPPLPAMTSWRKGLHDARALEALLARRGVELVLHGHVHRNVSHLGVGGMRVFGTASASSVGGKAGAAYRCFEVTDVGDRWRVEMRLMDVLPDGAVSLRERATWISAGR